MDLLCFCSVLCLLCFVRVCLYVLCGHLLGKGWPLGFRLWCLLWVCHFPIGILGQVWYFIVSIPDLCTLTYFAITLYVMWIVNTQTRIRLSTASLEPSLLTNSRTDTEKKFKAKIKASSSVVWASTWDFYTYLCKEQQKAQLSLHICADSSEPSMLVYTNNGCR